jgi:hypothetical protein
MIIWLCSWDVKLFSKTVLLSLSLHNNSASNAKLWLLEITERLPDLMGGSEDNQSKASKVLSSVKLNSGSHGGIVLSADNISNASYSPSCMLL